MKHLILFWNAYIILSLQTNAFGQRQYINSTLDDYFTTNTDYFCIPNTTENQNLTTIQKDFFSSMRYAQAMSEVSKDGNARTVGNVEISSVKFTKQDHLISFYIENLKMIILKPIKASTAKRPCVLISIGGANANFSEFPFLTTVTQYLMKGYVVAYFENPNINPNAEYKYLEAQMGKQTAANQPKVIFPAAVYLGVQVATAAAKYMSFHADIYNVNPNEFYGLGQSLGSHMVMNLGLGNISNYNNLKAPINKLDGLNFWVADNMVQKTFTMKAISLWASAYPLDGPDTNNPFGELIDMDDKTRVLHFQGLLDDKISYHSGWLLNEVNKSIYCNGVKDVITRFKNANVDYLSFVVCGGGHAVLDTSVSKPFILGNGDLSKVISGMNFDSIQSSYTKFKTYIDPSYHLFIQGTNIADMTASYFQNKIDLTSMPTINYITPISTTNGNFKQSNCMDQGFCIEFDQNIGVSCDDNDICTSNDKIQTDCTCQGIFMDEDNDGTCDAKDICPKSPEPGSSCDDMNQNTILDTINYECKCIGISSVDNYETKIVLSPNPFTENIQINSNLPIHNIAIVYPLKTKLVLNDHNIVEDISKYCLLPGIYILKIEVNGYSPMFKKMIKM
ncbi:MAG TPA: hypothetical protein PLE29_09595 [Saprospiraceae bacterium]|nr:hypothetical protein [Saprospiraceae bacterium]